MVSFCDVTFICGSSAVIMLCVFAVSSLVRASGALQEEEMQIQHNKEDRLVCWPPKASLNRTGGSSSGTDCEWRLMNIFRALAVALARKINHTMFRCFETFHLPNRQP